MTALELGDDGVLRVELDVAADHDAGGAVPRVFTERRPAEEWLDGLAVEQVVAVVAAFEV